MNAAHLRIYNEPADPSPAVADQKTQHHRQTVTMPLSDILPLLADAVASERTWLRDFEDDEITVSMDLYEVLLAYQHFRRPSA